MAPKLRPKPTGPPTVPVVAAGRVTQHTITADGRARTKNVPRKPTKTPHADRVQPIGALPTPDATPGPSERDAGEPPMGAPLDDDSAAYAEPQARVRLEPTETKDVR